MPLYKHILFDLDHTLWDFEKNRSETLQELYITHNLKSFPNFSVDDFIEKYKIINNKMWKEYNSGKITKEEIRERKSQFLKGKSESVTPDFFFGYFT